MGDWILPVLILVLLAIVGLIAWLVSMFLSSDTYQQRMSNPGQSGGAEGGLLTVRRDVRGIWQVLVQGLPYQKLEDVPDPEIRAEVLDAVRILAGFSRDYISRERKTSTPAQPAAPTSPSRELPSFQTKIPPKRSQRPPVFMPHINLAKEIGDILEKLLEEDPALTARSIHLQNTPDGSVTFIVDGRFYSSVTDIPDLEVQALIRTATRQWEESK